ncbi:OprO/OprP family phosphate-selective porin [Maridesulfovibrio frigidus]|uniref:OprO/OprP family phosphate-selective porin n=1 Tax=Maridesulfovibrio frigidus TaxID=340956 RepID=UPI0004E28D5B|nr:porin [Maridesulfovibrio frigidus]
MKKVSVLILSCMLTLLLAPAVFAAPNSGDEQKVDVADELITMAWLDRLKIESEDKAFRLKLGGTFSFDWGQINEDYRVASVYDSVQDHKQEVRYAKPLIDLKLYDDYDFRVQYEFVGTRGQFLDVWGQAKNIPYVGSLKVGHFKEPFSMAILTGDTGDTMMEYASSSVFSQSRNVGVQLSNTYLDGRINAAAGVFNKAAYMDDSFTNGNSGVDLTGRVGWRPYQEDDGRKLVHLGLGYSHQFLDGTEQSSSFSPKVGSNLSTIKLTGTGSMVADGQDLFNFELAGVWDQFWIMSELSTAYVDRKSDKDALFYGYHVDVGYIITGETKPFKSSNAVFGAIVPDNPFNPLKGGWGALEVALQYAHTDLNDSSADIKGGVQDNIGVALNWFLNSHTRVAANYIHAGVSDRENSSLTDGELDIYQCRISFYF